MPDDSASISRIVRFGVFDVDATSGELHKAGRRIALQEQPFRVLVALLERPGDLVTREQLSLRLWPDGTFVDVEHGLNAAVRRLRDALGDTAENPRFIETLPRRGYRFIAPVADAVRVAGASAHASVDASPPAPLSAPTLARGPAAPARRRSTAGLMLLVGLGLLAAGTAVTSVGTPAWWSARRPSAAPAPDLEDRHGRTRITLSVFDNATGAAARDPLGRVIAEHLIRAATRVDAVIVEPVPVAARPGRTDGSTAVASLLVRGTYYRHGERLEVQAHIVEEGAGRLLHSMVVSDVDPEAPRLALDMLGDALAGAIATHVDDFFGGLDVVSQVPGWSAYEEYRAGREVFASDYQAATAHLERALAGAPGFVPAEAVLLFAHLNQGHDKEVAALVDRWDGVWHRLTPAERLLVEFLRHLPHSRPADALRTLMALEPLAPRSLLVRFNLAQVLRETNRPRAAVEEHARLALDAGQLRHGIGTYRHDEWCGALHMLGDHEEELAVARRAQADQPDNLVFTRAAVRALAALGRVDEAVREADASRSVMPGPVVTPGDVLEEAALELRAHGHRAASLDLARRSAEWHNSRVDAARGRTERWALARALYLAERWDEARAVYRELAREFPGDSWFEGQAGAISARQGNSPGARAILVALRQPQADGFSMLAAARIAALVNDRDEGIRLLREAFARGLPYGLHVHRDVDLEALRDHPAYHELISPKG